MKEIQLSQGKVALIDDEDYELVSKYKWHVFKGPTNKTYYAQTCIKINDKLTTTYMHRIILNTSKGQEIDHRNDNGLDNQRLNIKFCTKSQNQQRKQMNRQNCLSKFRGVTWVKYRERWQAQIHVKHKNIWLGYFLTELKAALSYDQAAKKHHGEFASLNFPIGSDSFFADVVG